VEKKSNKTGLIVGILVGGIAVMGGIFLIVYMVRKRGEDQKFQALKEEDFSLNADVQE